MAGIFRSGQISFDGHIINNYYSGGNGTTTDRFVAKAKDTTTIICPPVSYPIDFDESGFCLDDSIQLKISSEYALTIDWYKNGNIINSGIEDSIFINTTGKYYAIVNPNTICTTTSDTIKVDNLANIDDTSDVEIWPVPTVDLGLDTVVCESVLLRTDSIGDNMFLWNTLASTPEIFVENSGIYWLNVSNVYGCETIDTVNVEVRLNPLVNLGDDFLMNSEETVILDGGIFPNHSSYLWDNGWTNRFRQINANSMQSGINTFFVEVVDDNGCTAQDSIEVCLCSSIHVAVFYDFNANGIQDDGELSCPFASLNINPGSFATYVNELQSGVTFYVEHGVYNIQLGELDDWEVLSGIAAYDITIDEANSYDTVTFALIPIDTISAIFSIITIPITRCDEMATLSVTVNNNGTTFMQNGTLWLEIDENIETVNFVNTPDQIIGMNRFGWNIEDISPGYSVVKQIELLIPNATNVPLGDSLHFISYVEYQDSNGEHLSEETNIVTEFLCSYDPNDKLVYPSRNAAYTLFNEALTYTIRFQNTGNDYARNIVIKDTLDANIDISSFRLIGSSHSESLIITRSMHELIFHFNDIFLPDSTSNFDESQGYIIFQVNVLDGIDEFTAINNTAAIFFDFNAAIATNTTENIMISSFDIIDGLDPSVKMKDVLVTIFPNPGANNIYLEFTPEISHIIYLYNALGKLIFMEENATNIDISNLAKGVYYLNIMEKEFNSSIMKMIIVE